MPDVMPTGGIESRILILRGQKVLLDRDLAELYGVTTSRFNEQVKRNLMRFPSDFMFQLTEAEAGILRSQIAISRLEWGGLRYLPLAFTEHGVAMLASVLRSERAIEVNIAIVRAFARLERKADTNFQVVFDAIEHLMAAGEIKKGRKLGFGKE